MSASAQKPTPRAEHQSPNQAILLAGQEAVDFYLKTIRDNADLLRRQFAKLEQAVALHRSILAQDNVAEPNPGASPARPKLYIVPA